MDDGPNERFVGAPLRPPNPWSCAHTERTTDDGRWTMESRSWPLPAADSLARKPPCPRPPGPAPPTGVIDLAAERARRRVPGPLALAATVAAALVLLVGAWGWSAESEANSANTRLATIQAALKAA